MENASRALEIAAGVLLAVLILSLIVYFFSKIGEWPEQQDDMMSSEQLAKFNQEYEVYEKKMMYGVDVISCFNKAQSNNEKYVEGEGFLTGSTSHRNDVRVDVYVRIAEPLDEVMEIYYLDEVTNREKQRFNDNADSWTGVPNDDNFRTLVILGNDVGNKLNPATMYTAFTRTTALITTSNNLETAGRHLLPDGGTSEYNGHMYYSLDDQEIRSLLEFSAGNPKMVITNTNNATLRSWSKAVWTTALYSFKTKRFRCDGIEYNASRKNKWTLFF